MSWFGNALRTVGSGLGKAAGFVGGLIGGGSPQTGGPLPSGMVGTIGGTYVPVASTVTSPNPQSGSGIIGTVNGITGFLDSISGFFNTSTNTVNSVGTKVGGALDVLSGEKAIQTNVTSDLIPKWVFPILGGFGAILLYNMIKKK